MQDPDPHGQPLSPSDVARGDLLGKRRDRVRVAGRVVRVADDGVALADAFAAIDLETTEPWPVMLGDFVVCDASLRREPPGAEGAGHPAPTSASRPGRGASSERRLVDAVLREMHHPRRVAPATPEDDPHVLGPAIEARARLLGEIRRFFAERGFVEVDTPVMVRSPGLDAHLDAFEVRGGVAREPAYLITSPEYHMKRLLSAGVPRLFQVSHCFRRGEVGSRHNPEFTMLEWYRAFSGYERIMRDTEELVRSVVRQLTGRSVLRYAGLDVQFDEPFARRTVAELFFEHAPGLTDDPSLLAREDEERFFRAWIDRVEPAVARSPVPLFVTHFPATQASLARLCPDDPRWCERFELYAAGVELCNGFGELTDPTEQRARLLADRRRRADAGAPVYPVDERFLAALERGMPPSGGNALGLDRLLMLCLEAESIASVQAFPVERL